MEEKHTRGRAHSEQSRRPDLGKVRGQLARRAPMGGGVEMWQVAREGRIPTRGSKKEGMKSVLRVTS